MTATSSLIGNFGQANDAAAKLGIAALPKSIALDMARYNVRSNCIAPFAWSRMTRSIPAETDEEKTRVEKLKKMEADKVAPMGGLMSITGERDGLPGGGPHPGGGVTPMTASPLRFSDSPVEVEYRWAPPLLRQHTEEGLREVLGKSPQAIAEFVSTRLHQRD